MNKARLFLHFPQMYDVTGLYFCNKNILLNNLEQVSIYQADGICLRFVSFVFQHFMQTKVFHKIETLIKGKTLDSHDNAEREPVFFWPTWCRNYARQSCSPCLFTM